MDTEKDFTRRKKQQGLKVTQQLRSNRKMATKSCRLNMKRYETSTKRLNKQLQRQERLKQAPRCLSPRAHRLILRPWTTLPEPDWTDSVDSDNSSLV